MKHIFQKNIYYTGVIGKSNTYLPRNDLFIDLNGLVSKERRVPCCHLVDEHAQRPPVYGLVITLVDREVVQMERGERKTDMSHNNTTTSTTITNNNN